MNFKTAAAASLLAFGAFALVAPTMSYAASMKADTDKDGTIDMAEAKTAGMAHFDKMDKDHEGKLDSKEAGMDVSALDTDKDGSLDKAEYEQALASSFKAADTDNDGTLDAKELKSSAGKSVAAMIK